MNSTNTIFSRPSYEILNILINIKFHVRNNVRLLIYVDIQLYKPNV